MDEFESDLSRMMRETRDVTTFDPEQRERLQARIRSRRRARVALMLGGSAMTLVALGAGLLALPGTFTTRADVASAPSAGRSADAGSTGSLTVPPGVSGEERNVYLTENAVASCMRAKGFQYTPHVEKWQDLSAAVDGAGYAAAKDFRERYGFGLYAGAAYPDDPKAPGSKASEPKPSAQSRYVNSLSPRQRTAYDQALTGGPAKADRKRPGGCTAEAQEKVYGPAKSEAELDQESQTRQEKDQASAEALNGDPQLVGLAKSYATCLRNGGIAVSTTQPTRIGDAVKFDLAATLPTDGVTGMSRTTAQALLRKEIKRALIDLECGKAFRAAYFPKLKLHPRYPG